MFPHDLQIAVDTRIRSKKGKKEWRRRKLLTEKAVSIKSHMNKFLCHVHIIKVCMGNESLAFLTILSAYVQKNFFYPLVELYVHFLLPISKNLFSCTECEKMLISRKLFLKISSLQPPTATSHKKYIHFVPVFPISIFFSSVWHMRRESHFIHCTFMGLIWLSHTWQLFFSSPNFPFIFFIHILN